MTPLASMTASRHSLSAAAPAVARCRPEPEVDARPDLQSSGTDQPIFGKGTRPVIPAPGEIAFGSFRLVPAQFLLLEGDNPVRLGSRALEILIVLLERPGEVVSVDELMARVWPNTFVDPGNLTVHISALRRTLHDGRDGNRFVINIPGRGYSFVASVEISKLKGHRSKVTWAPTLHKFRSDSPTSELAGGRIPACRVEAIQQSSERKFRWTWQLPRLERRQRQRRR